MLPDWQETFVYNWTCYAFPWGGKMDEFGGVARSLLPVHASVQTLVVLTFLLRGIYMA